MDGHTKIGHLPRALFDIEFRQNCKNRPAFLLFSCYLHPPCFFQSPCRCNYIRYILQKNHSDIRNPFKSIFVDFYTSRIKKRTLNFFHRWGSQTFLPLFLKFSFWKAPESLTWGHFPWWKSNFLWTRKNLLSTWSPISVAPLCFTLLLTTPKVLWSQTKETFFHTRNNMIYEPLQLTVFEDLNQFFKH